MGRDTSSGKPVRTARSYVGSPETVATKIVATVKDAGLDRFDMKYSSGTLPHDKLDDSIELFGTRVGPRVRDLASTDTGRRWPPDFWYLECPAEKKPIAPAGAIAPGRDSERGVDEPAPWPRRRSPRPAFSFEENESAPAVAGVPSRRSLTAHAEFAGS
jgi:hypothetical protein